MWKQLWDEQRGSVVGLGSGLLLGFIYLFAGFWNMLVFAFIVAIAYVAGKHYATLELFLQEWTQRLMDRFRL
jgi:hypothetical protein